MIDIVVSFGCRCEEGGCSDIQILIRTVTMATIVSIRNVRWYIDGEYTVHTVIRDREWGDTQQSTSGATQQNTVGYCNPYGNVAVLSMRICKIDGWQQDIIQLMIGFLKVASGRERGLYIYPTINHNGKTQQYTTYWNSCGNVGAE